jgi:hypothetical protein
VRAFGLASPRRCLRTARGGSLEETSMGTRQSEIPGTERKIDRKVTAAAELFHGEFMKWKKLGKKKDEAKDALIAVMHEKGLTIYFDDTVIPPLVVRTTDKTTVKVEAKKKPEPAEDDGKKTGGDA